MGDQVIGTGVVDVSDEAGDILDTAGLLQSCYPYAHTLYTNVGAGAVQAPQPQHSAVDVLNDGVGSHGSGDQLYSQSRRQS